MLKIMLSEWIPYYRPLLNNKLILSEQPFLAAGKFRQRHSHDVSHFFREAKGNMFSVHTKGVAVDLPLLSAPCVPESPLKHSISLQRHFVSSFTQPSALYSKSFPSANTRVCVCVCE